MALTNWMVNMIEPDELYELAVELTEIKMHLKRHFDLWGNNQPWHLFDKLHLGICTLAVKIDEEDNEA